MHIALVYIPAPRYPLSDTEIRYGKAFFHKSIETYFKNLPPDFLKHLWEVEKVNQGLLYIASYLKKNGYTVSYFAYASNPYIPKIDSTSKIIKAITKQIDEIDLVCIHSITCNYHIAEYIARVLKERKPELVIGLGGPHASAIPSQIFDKGVYSNNNLGNHNGISPFDFIGIGEGEETILEVVQILQRKGVLEPVSGIAIKTNGVVIKGPRRERSELVKYPIPAYELANIDKLPAARIFPNRGCPNSCHFCADPWRKKVTYVTLDRIAEEIDFLYSRYDTRYLYVGCEDFFCDQKRAREIAETIYSTHSDISWTAQCRVNSYIDTNTLDLLLRCGCVGLEFGVESSNQSILDRVNKNIRLEDAKKCFEIAKSFGFYTHAYWMLGLPGENSTTAEHTQKTMQAWAEKGFLDTWEYKIYIPYPGTPIYRYPEEYGINILTHDYRYYHYALDPVISTDGLTPKELRSLYLKGLSLSASLMEKSEPD